MSLETCQNGGNVAENAEGGKRSNMVWTGHYVRGVEFVTALGEIVHFGGKVYKDVSSYDIVHLMVGSEGTHGIITKIYLKVIPLPKERIVILAPFDDVNQALRLPVILLKEMKILPTSLEFMNHESLCFAYNIVTAPIPFQMQNQCMIEID